MKLHPPEFTAEPGDPFANDRLERQPQVKSFCQMLLGVEGHAIVSLDGPWGSGKTAFSKMCAAYLRSEESRETKPAGVVEFNAWQQGHTGSPLIDLVSALSEKVGNETKNKLIQDAFKLGARVVTHGVLHDRLRLQPRFWGIPRVQPRMPTTPTAPSFTNRLFSSA